MRNLESTAEDLFNKIRGRFRSVTIGDGEGKVTNDPKQARFFDFDYKVGSESIGKVSVSIDPEKLSVMYANTFIKDQNKRTRNEWYSFLRELRQFAKKRLLKFDVRDITKTNLDRRDYQFLSQPGTNTMSESKLYGTSQVSYQKIGEARLNIRHRSHINQEQSAARTRNIDKIFIESPEGERFKYPYKHLAGARAMARHVSEGGTPFDEFGKHIIGLSEEQGNLKKFKTYVNRSKVMAEGLKQYVDIIENRTKDVKRELQSISTASKYYERLENHENVVLEDVPEDVKTNWIDELTIKQFNEDLKDIFPYVYRLIGEANKTKEISPEDVDSEFASPAPRSDIEDDAESSYADTADDEPQDKTQNTSVTEFILSHYDRNTGSWPRGETAVLTSVEKDFGESYIEPAKQFIERVNQTYSAYTEGCDKCDEPMPTRDEKKKRRKKDTVSEGMHRLKHLAGL